MLSEIDIHVLNLFLGDSVRPEADILWPFVGRFPQWQQEQHRHLRPRRASHLVLLQLHFLFCHQLVRVLTFEIATILLKFDDPQEILANQHLSLSL